MIFLLRKRGLYCVEGRWTDDAFQKLTLSPWAVEAPPVKSCTIILGFTLRKVLGRTLKVLERRSSRGLDPESSKWSRGGESGENALNRLT